MRRVAIVTGASRGIGKACAIKLAEDGIDIVVNYNNSEEAATKVVEEIKKLGCDAIAVKADVSKNSDVKMLFKEAHNHFGRLDILVNNVGVVDDAFIMMFSDSSLERSLDINIKVISIVAGKRH
jgi:3-oxoacyl-[acyl-carrier protein] reductase